MGIFGYFMNIVSEIFCLETVLKQRSTKSIFANCFLGNRSLCAFANSMSLRSKKSFNNLSFG